MTRKIVFHPAPKAGNNVAGSLFSEKSCSGMAWQFGETRGMKPMIGNIIALRVEAGSDFFERYAFGQFAGAFVVPNLPSARAR